MWKWDAYIRQDILSGIAAIWWNRFQVLHVLFFIKTCKLYYFHYHPLNLHLLLSRLVFLWFWQRSVTLLTLPVYKYQHVLKISEGFLTFPRVARSANKWNKLFSPSLRHSRVPVLLISEKYLTYIVYVYGPPYLLAQQKVFP